MKSCLKNFLLLIAAFLVGILITEGGLRLFFGDKYEKRPGFYVADRVLGWKPAAGLDHTFYGPDFSTRITTDAEGHRLGRLGEVDYDKELLVLCGDSFTFGWGVSTGGTFASLLEEKVFAASGGRVRAVNLGVGGYGTFQSAFRLKNLLDNHPEAKLRAVLVIHTHNDMTDNLKSIGYHAGVWGVRTVSSRERSFWHVVNLARYGVKTLKDAWRSKASGAVVKKDGTDPFFQDMLWAYRRTTPGRLPLTVRINGRDISLRGVSAEDTSPRRTFERKQLTGVQRELLLESIRMIHGLVEDQRIPVIHTFIYTTFDWYIREVEELVRQAPAYGNRIITAGKVPPAGSYGKPFGNDHSGGHYNPAFNAFWAENMLDELRREQVVE